MNVLVVGKSAVFDKVVKKDVQDKLAKRTGLRGPFAALAGRAAAKMVTEDAIAAKLARKIPKAMPAEMAALGIQAEVEEVYRKGSFVVLRVRIIKCDLNAMITKAEGAEKARNAQRVLGCLRGVATLFGYGEYFDDSVDFKVRRKVVDGMCEMLPKLSEKMAEVGLEVDIVAKSEPEEAAFFFEVLKHLEQCGSCAPLTEESKK